MELENGGEPAPKKQGRGSGLAPPWKPGQSGNPKGRAKGSRNALGEAFLEALYQDFVEHGEDAIVQVRENDPAAYLRVIAGILPQKLEAELTLKPSIQGLPLYQQAPMRTIEHQPLEAIGKDE